MEKAVKKVLILTYYWPPSGGAGVQRWLKFVKYLRQHQWEPIIYTPENPEFPELDTSLQRDIPSDLTILRTKVWEPYGWYKKLMGRKKEERINAAFLSEKKQNPQREALAVWIRGNLFIPDARTFWIRPSVRFLCRYLKEHPVDAIVSTGPPHSLHLIALKINRKLNIPWLADFRDPWTNIDFYKDLRLTLPADLRHRWLEKKVLRKATAVTVISRTMSSDFNRIFPRNYDVVTNGFDPDDNRANSIREPDKRFSIAHIGTLVQSRNPETLWKTLSELIHSHSGLADDLEFKFIGKTDHSVIASLEQYGLMSYVNRIPYLPHDQVTDAQRSAQVLLLIINQTPNARMILTGKFFEYLAAGRPILCLGPADGDAASILEETGSGILIEPGDTPKMKNAILTLYQEYRDGTLMAKTKNIDQYSRKNLTGVIAGILNRISQ